jgi:hypothetical protein
MRTECVRDEPQMLKDDTALPPEKLRTQWAAAMLRLVNAAGEDEAVQVKV